MCIDRVKRKPCSIAKIVAEMAFHAVKRLLLLPLATFIFIVGSKKLNICIHRKKKVRIEIFPIGELWLEGPSVLANVHKPRPFV